MSQKVIQAQGRAYSEGMLKAQLPPPEIGSDRWVRETEHELMIAGHEIDCTICIAANRPRTFSRMWFGA